MRPRRIILAGLILGIVPFLDVGIAPAQDSTAAPAIEGAAPPSPPAASAKEEKKPEKLKTGIVASYGKLPKIGSINVADTNAAPGDEPNPVSGSINRRGTDKCVAVLTNNSKDYGYSVSFDVVGTNAKGGGSLKKSYSTTLGPGKSSEHNFSCRKDMNFAVNLKSGKALK